MNAPATSRRLELAEIFRAYGDRLERLSLDQRRVMAAITRCRTAALGGHRSQCDTCGHQEIFYNSCRDRHCPKCQGLDEARWVQDRKQDLLPVEYFHVVFTVPEELHCFFRANPKTAYGLLFSNVSETLQDVALNPKHLGAKVGFTAVLHTWTQKLLFHPHLHCIVPGGGLSPDGRRWIQARPGFLLPVRILSTVFRGKLLSRLQHAVRQGTITLPSAYDPWLQLSKAASKKWVVYAKPPFAGPDQVISYLARYTHRIGISNDRLVSLKDGKVTFRWKDRAKNDAPRLMTLDAVSFLRRFLYHVLPVGLVRIRHFGFLANAVRKKRLLKCRMLLAVAIPSAPEAETDEESWQKTLLRLTGKDVTKCPRCRKGRLVELEELPAIGVYGWLAGRGASP